MDFARAALLASTLLASGAAHANGMRILFQAPLSVAFEGADQFPGYSFFLLAPGSSKVEPLPAGPVEASDGRRLYAVRGPLPAAVARELLSGPDYFAAQQSTLQLGTPLWYQDRRHAGALAPADDSAARYRIAGLASGVIALERIPAPLPSSVAVMLGISAAGAIGLGGSAWRRRRKPASSAREET
jgi:hypothetical protein